MVILAIGTLALSHAASGQSRQYKLAVLSGQSPNSVEHLYAALFKRLGELGYVDGKNLRVGWRYAEGDLNRLATLAGEVVALKPDVIVAGASQAALAASRATRTIPIVFTAVSDPVGQGIVQTLARPGTNATGLSAQNIEIQAKRLQLLKEVFPASSRIAVLHNPLNIIEQKVLEALKEASVPLKLELQVHPIRHAGEFDSVFAVLEKNRPDVLYVVESPFSFLHRSRIAAFANKRRLPAVYPFAEYTQAGGLMSYSFSVVEQYRIAADVVARILAGADPAGVPVEQPTRFELVINRKTATAQGVVFPAAILARADRIID